MAVLPYLPEELLQRILWHLKLATGSGHTDMKESVLRTRTLLSCMTASRTLYRLASPVLYHTLTYTKDLHLVAHHLAHNPSLADQVRELVVAENDCHESFLVMDNHDDLQWPQYMHARMSAHRSFLSYPNYDNDSTTCGYNLPVATFALIVCTNIHTLIMHDFHQEPEGLEEEFLTQCLALGQADPKGSHVPLARLSRISVRQPTSPHPGPSDLDIDEEEDGHQDGGSWLSCLVRLPRITSLSLRDIPSHSKHADLSLANIKSLALSDTEDLSATKLENPLEAWPMLETFDVACMNKYDSRVDMDWDAIGSALTQYGSKLRKIRLDTHKVRLPSLEQRGLINLATLSHLRSLTLPVEAVLSEPVGEHLVPASNHDQDRDPSHAENTEDEEFLDDEDDFWSSHPPGEGLNTPTVPLHQLLPCSLRHLRIIDDWDLWTDAIRLDVELRRLMLLPDFSELRSIRVKREIPYSKHVKDLGWRHERRAHRWNVLLRL
jgi:hypothetical protein